MSENWGPLLVAAARRDLETRARLVESGELFGGYHPEMEKVHDENAALLARVFDDIGWPGRREFGDDGAGAAFLILQHAIGHPDLQRRGLALILDAIPEGQANPLDAAYLADRIAIFEGAEQTFGTQFDWDANGQLSPAPVRDPESLDERRASVGLPPIAETIANMRANAAAENETAPPDLAERRAAYDAWARKAGWRA
ncbi:DUF6624 domain-containing protein [Candidatus Viadribacter manganicus]|uniref:Uncharacterized protein n=1 Tax=Candidatus Viadribacter manganicus TaxID=1759059 RepID=A0A1B1AIK3_9PROT|nr:DUF6624 domain-containing protein [Candidatus Viadribacter manganicus]ANP46399.1 hypothetical protein ATE48_10965 [Candidatus Viadribacter manganicus]